MALPSHWFICQVMVYLWRKTATVIVLPLPAVVDGDRDGDGAVTFFFFLSMYGDADSFRTHQLMMVITPVVSYAYLCMMIVIIFSL